MQSFYINYLKWPIKLPVLEKKNTYKRLGPFKRTTRRLFEHKEKDTDLEED